MRKITFTDPHRQKHFDFFSRMDQPHFSICLQLEITETLKRIKADRLHFTSTMVYLIARTANEIPVFRQRIREGEAIEHERVHPSFTVQTRLSDVFSFCEVPYQEAYSGFVADTQKAMTARQEQPSFEDEAGRDDYLFLSSFPWASFTGLTHAMHYSPADSVPRFTWGKYYQQENKVLMPLSIQVHHALVDGKHVGEYCRIFEENTTHPHLWLA